MKRMDQQDSKAGFAYRLETALLAAGCEVTPTKVAKAFNLRYPHEAVTLQAARKWILGTSLPTAAKLHALAEWLAVDPAWLHYGETSTRTAPSLPARADSLEQDLALLTPHERALIRNMLDLIFEARQRGKP